MGTTVAVGLDVVDVRRIAVLRRRYGRAELGLIFTERERRDADRSRMPDRHYAVCFGAKESVGKALGVGMAGIDWCDVQSTIRWPSVAVTTTGAAAELAARLGISRWVVATAIHRHCVLVAVIACVHCGAQVRPHWTDRNECDPGRV
jgi:holo-[acyl-carrier protein] synthase